MFPVTLPLDLLFAFIIALIFAWILASSYRGRGVTRAGAWPIFFVFFLLILFATWAGGVWLVPFGPVLWGGYWLPFVAVGIIVWLLIAAFAWESPPRRLDKSQPVAPEQAGDEGVAIVLTVFFWIVIIVLLVSLFTHYWWWR